MSGGEVEFVRLTGQPRAIRGSDELTFLPDKRFHLLTYLAYNSGWVGRERAAFLFWPDADTESSRRNLRGLLQRLRTLPFDPGIEANKHQLRWEVPTDVKLFNEAVESGDVDTAIESYHGPLLEGLESDDAGEFGEWLEIAREELRSRWRGLALTRLAESAPGEDRSAESLLKRLLEADPLDEEAVRSFMGAMARLGKLVAARTAYREFAGRLERELGLEPTSETALAYNQLADAVPPFGSQVSPGSQQTPANQRSSRLPQHSTTFIGRAREVRDVGARLRDPACRLLTLVGTGGVGKTRLAIAVAHDLEAEFSTGAAFVSLDAIVSVDDLASTVGKALGVPLPANAGPADLIRALSDEAVLLVFDNCEHLPGLATHVKSILEACGQVKVLATSRERLALTDEWIYQVDGLPFPAVGSTVVDLEDFASIALFMERARRVNPSFNIASGDLPTLARLGAHMEGLPLAIELAAAWARALSLREIAADVEQNLDLLTSAAIDGLPRHASIRATFEQSWALLSTAERTALRRLSLFQTAVTAEAAQFVARASRLALAALVDKSLLRLGADGRYHRHPLLRMFTQEKLAAEPDELAVVQRRHASYYLRFLRERTDAARGPRPAAVLREIDSDLAEILSAVEAAIERGKDSQVIGFMRLLAFDLGYFPARGYSSRSLSLLRKAADVAVRNSAWEAAHILTGRLADAHGTHMDDAKRAFVLYKRAAELAANADNLGRQAVYWSMSGVMASRLGSEEADALLDEALAMAERSQDLLSLATVLEHRAFTMLVRGDHDASRDIYRRSLAVVDRLQVTQAAESYEVRRLRFFCLLNLGEAERHLDCFAEAMASRTAALAIAKESGNPIWVAFARQELGEMHATVGENALATEHLGEALALYRENHVTAHVERLTTFMEEHGLATAAEVAVAH